MTEPAVSVGPAVLNNPDNPTLSATPKDRRLYTCLCGCMHLRTAAMVIGAIETTALTIAILSVIIRFAQGNESVGSLVGTVLSIIVWAAAVVCLFVAITRQYPPLLLPHIVIQILSAIGLVILAIVLSATTISVALHNYNTKALSYGFGILVVVLLATGLDTWFTLVVAKYYHFLRGQL